MRIIGIKDEMKGIDEGKGEEELGMWGEVMQKIGGDGRNRGEVRGEWGNGKVTKSLKVKIRGK